VRIRLLLAAGILSGCATGADRLRQEIRSGQTSGAYVESVPFEPQQPGACGPCALASLLSYWGRPFSQGEISARILPPGAKAVSAFSLWRFARGSGLAALQVPAPGLSPETLDALLAQGIPVILDLADPVRKELQHFVLAVGHDRARGLWVIQDGRRADSVVPESWLGPRWQAADRWALIVFPPEKWVSGLGPALHLKAAERVRELGRPAEASRHLAEAEKGYREAMHADPKRPEPFNNLSLILLEGNRLDEAEALARTAVTLSGSDGRRLPYALDTLGQVFLRQERKVEASRAFALALKTLPADCDLAKEIRGRMGAS